MEMEKGRQTLFAIEPPQGLYEAVLSRIAAARMRAARVRASTLGLIAFVCGIALVPTLQYAAQEFYASGFYDYLSLLGSDRSFVLSSWRDVMFSLVEALPSLALLLVLALGGLFVWSLARLVRTAPVAFRKARV